MKVDKSAQLRKEIGDLNNDLLAIGRQPEQAVQRCGEYGRRLIEADLLVPTVIGFCPEGLLFAPVPFADYEQKREITSSVAAALAQMGASLAVVIAESWMSKKQGTRRPSADPNRTEALTVDAVNPDGTVAALLVNPFEHTRSGIKWGEAYDDNSTKEQYFLPAWSELANVVSAPFVN